MLKQGSVNREQAFGQHPLLHGCNAVRGIQPLHAAIGVQQVVFIRHGHLLLIVQKGVFLHITGQRAALLADRTARRRRRVHRHAKLFQGARVEHPHMPGLVHDHDRVLCRYPVQHFPRRMPLFGQGVLVVPLADHPLSLRDMILRDKPRKRVRDVVKAGRLVQRGLQQRVRRAGKMAVRIHKGRQKRASLEVDLRRALRPAPQMLQTAHRSDYAVFGQQRLSQPLCLHRADWPAIIQRFHSLSLPFAVLFSVYHASSRIIEEFLNIYRIEKNFIPY